jgi:hypothetical protein
MFTPEQKESARPCATVVPPRGETAAGESPIDKSNASSDFKL